MKRIIATILLLSVLSVASFCMIGGAAGKEKANVTIKENIIYGDKSYADGVTVFTKAHYNDHLFWNTTYTIGEKPRTSTDYEFRYFPHYEDSERSYHALTLDVGAVGDRESRFENLSRAFGSDGNNGGSKYFSQSVIDEE